MPSQSSSRSRRIHGLGLGRSSSCCSLWCCSCSSGAQISGEVVKEDKASQEPVNGVSISTFYSGSLNLLKESDNGTDGPYRDYIEKPGPFSQLHLCNSTRARLIRCLSPPARHAHAGLIFGIPLGCNSGHSAFNFALPRALCTSLAHSFRFLDQLAQADTQAVRKGLRHIEARISFSALHQSDVRLMDVRLLRKQFLRNAFRLPVLLQDFAENCCEVNIPHSLNRLRIQ